MTSNKQNAQTSEMIRLQPNEQILTGAWLVEDGHARGDAACERIEWLITHHLEKIANSPQSGAWETLYRDPDDGRYWERTYLQSEMHGGGPPQLKCVTTQQASKKYGGAVVASQ
jgi:hypothetical protein